MVEVSSVVDAGNFRSFLTSIKMTVEMDHRDRSISTIDRSKKRKGDCMVTTESDDSRQSSFFLCRTFLGCIGLRWAGQEIVMPLFDLSQGEGIIVSKTLLMEFGKLSKRPLRSNWNVTTVKYSGPAVERVGSKRNVVTSTTTRQHFMLFSMCGLLTRGSIFENLVEFRKVQIEHQVDMKCQYRKVHLSYSRSAVCSREDWKMLTDEGDVIFNVTMAQARLIWEATKG